MANLPKSYKHKTNNELIEEQKQINTVHDTIFKTLSTENNLYKITQLNGLHLHI